MVDPIVTDVKAEGSKVVAWFKLHWPHLVTWLGIVSSFFRAHL